MKKLLLLSFSLILLGNIELQAQHKQLLYDFQEIPQSILLNPGVETPYKWYSGIPIVSGFSTSIGSSGIAAGDIFANDGLDITDKIRARVINGMSANDEFSFTNQVEVVNVGFRGKNNSENFYSFGAYNEFDFITYWPKDLAILAFEGNANELGRLYDLSHLKLRGELLNVYHFGVNRKINDRLTMGVRGKLYSSIVDFNSSHNKGYFVTNIGSNNLIENTIVADMELRTSGIKSVRDAARDSEKGNVKSTLISRGLLGGNLGLGADFGFSYYIDEQTVITGSVLDLGFIYHTKDLQNYTLKGSASNEGLIINVDNLFASNNFWQDLIDDVEEDLPFENTTNNYITFRPTKLYGSYRYNFKKQNPKGNGRNCGCSYKKPNNLRIKNMYLNSVGGQVYVINRPKGPQVSLTGFYQRKLGNFLTAKASYTVNKFSYTNVGLGVSIKAGFLNMYLMADNLLAYQNLANSQYASFQFGLNIIPWNNNR